MVFINSEGKINKNTYLIDGLLFKISGNIGIYIIENNGMRMMMDTSSEIAARKIMKKLEQFGLLPIHKLLLTHSHWDHAQGVGKLRRLLGDIEVLASENALKDLKSPERMAEPYEFKVKPVEDVTPLKEGDIVDLNGLELEIMNFFGHTMDSIALLDKKNRNIFVGDAIIDRLAQDAFFVSLMPPDFNEGELLKTFNKLRDMRDELNSIAIAHFGVWKDNHFEQILNEMEDLYFKVKNALIEWYNENPSIENITSKYCSTFLPNSKFWNEKIFVFIIDMMINGLKLSGFIK